MLSYASGVCMIYLQPDDVMILMRGFKVSS